MVDNNVDVDPGLFYPQLMMGVRDLQVFPLYGEEKLTGALTGPIFPTNGINLLIAGIGNDAQAGSGVVGASVAGTTTTLAASVAVGASTASLTSTAGIVAGTTILQFDVNSSVGPTTAECRMVASLAGSVATLDAPFVYAHANAASVQSVQAPFTHTISQAQAQSLPSLTLEKNIGGFQSIQYAGTRVNKLQIKAQTTNTEAEMTADVIAQTASVLSTPSSLSYINESPFVFAEYTMMWNGGSLQQASNFQMTVDNMLKAIYTMNGSHDLQFLSPTSLKVNGSFDVVFDSLTDATYGYFTDMRSGTEGSLSLTLAHPTASAGSVTFTMPLVRFALDKQTLKMSDVVLEQLTWEARRPVTGSSLYTIQATVANGTHLAY